MSCNFVRKQLQVGKFENARLKQQFAFKTDFSDTNLYIAFLIHFSRMYNYIYKKYNVRYNAKLH